MTTGTNGDDTLIGTNGNDTLVGLAGHDLIDGLHGNDFLDGGEVTSMAAQTTTPLLAARATMHSRAVVESRIRPLICTHLMAWW